MSSCVKDLSTALQMIYIICRQPLNSRGNAWTEYPPNEYSALWVNSTTVFRSDINVKESRSIAVTAGCASESQWDAGDSFEDIIKCLREKSATELISIQRKLETNGESFNGPNIDEADGVLPGSIEELLRNRRPYGLMIGTVSREGRYTKFIVNKQGEINQPLLFATCVLLVEGRGFKRVRTIAEACADDYTKRRTFFLVTFCFSLKYVQSSTDIRDTAVRNTRISRTWVQVPNLCQSFSVGGSTDIRNFSKFLFLYFEQKRAQI